MKLKKSIIIIFICTMISSLIVFPLETQAKDKVIKVGYPTMQNLSMKDKDGNLYGYDYDYLMQISQYTGWEYEFIEVEGDTNTQLMTLFQMLTEGQIDLLGGLSYNEQMAKMLDFPSEPYGYSYDVLVAKNDSDIYDQNSLINKGNISIAINENSSSKAEKLQQYAKMNGFEYTEVKYKTHQELLDLLDEGTVDVAYTTDLAIPSNTRAVARFFPSPFYFASTKGKNDIVSHLNQALIDINDTNPSFSSNLYNYYFTGTANEFILNSSERKYTESHKTLTVLARSQCAPIQYGSQDNIKGIGKDILDRVSEKTGIRFDYTFVSTSEEYDKLSQNQKFDIYLGVPNETKVSEKYDVNLSTPYLSGNLTLVVNDKIDPNDLRDKKQAVNEVSFQRFDENNNVLYYDNASELLKAVNNGEADYAYLNTYFVSYYMSHDGLADLATFTVPDYLKSAYSFGIKKSSDLSLLSIVNKAIRSLESEMNSIIYKNGYVEKKFNLMNFLYDHIMIVMIISLLIVSSVIYFIRRYYKQQLKMKRAIELEYQRYQMLSEMSGEMLFMYDYHKDELKISKSAQGKIMEQEMIDHFFERMSQQEECDEFVCSIYEYLLKQEDVVVEKQFILLDNEEKWYQITLNIAYDKANHKEDAVYGMGKVVDIQNTVVEKQVLKRKSQTDPLTGLWNRAGAREHINYLLQNDDKVGALLMFDLDNFKEINDSYGHIIGDEVLRDIAYLLGEVFVDGVCARLGGDEFIIYVHDTTRDSIEARCENLLKRIRYLKTLDNKPAELTLSLGVVFTTYSRNLTRLVELADESLYEVKRNGKNSYHIYNK